MTSHATRPVPYSVKRPGMLLQVSGRGPPVNWQDGDYFSMLSTTIERLKNTQSLADFCDVVAGEARRITGLDRALVYRIHSDDSGEVVADARREDLPSWQGLRCPAGDIPKPLRGASVMYTEYLHHMGVAATLTMPILRDGALWGLIACHHCSPIALPYPLRSAAEFLGQIASLEIAQAELREHLEYRSHLDAVHLAVLARAAGDGQLAVVAHSPPSLLDGIEADGVAIFQHARWLTAGVVPEAPHLKPLAAWLRARIEQAPHGAHNYATDALAQAYPAAAAFAHTTSGVLATAVSRHPDSPLILWFRAEQLQTFTWAGNPHGKPAVGPVGSFGPRLTPRRGFELWQEQVRGRSKPWMTVEIEAAQQLRRMVIDLVVVRADQLAEANAELARSNAELDAFAYVVGHDLKEPLRGINNYAQRLLEDARAGRVQDPERIAWLLRMTGCMDTLLSALLHFSRVGRQSLDRANTDLGAVLVESMEMLGARLAESKVEVRVPRPLPVAHCDRVRVREVFSNLISNAAKYNDKAQTWVEIGYINPDDVPSGLARPATVPAEARHQTLFYVRDNGIGIDARHRDRVFEIFKRLHAQDAFGGGSGVGLTIARKMVEQHHGRIWFDSVLGEGTTFNFTLPSAKLPANSACAA